MYAVQNVMTKSTVNRWVQRFMVGQMSTDDKPRNSRASKRRIRYGMPPAPTNLSVDMKNASLGMEIMLKSRL